MLQPVQERPDSNSQPATATSSDKHPADKGGSCDRAVSEWLQTVNASGSKILQTVNSGHMLVCFTHPWLPHHAGLSISTEEHIAAPSSLAGIKSHLATEFELLGRNGGWNPATQQGNPMHSKIICMHAVCIDAHQSPPT